MLIVLFNINIIIYFITMSTVSESGISHESSVDMTEFINSVQRHINRARILKTYDYDVIEKTHFIRKLGPNYVDALK